MGKVRLDIITKLKKAPKVNSRLKGAGFSLKNKILLCVLVPVLFMVLIGAISYQRAESGLNRKYTDATQATLSMAGDYFDVIATFIKAEASPYVFDDKISKYFMGSYDNDMMEIKKVTDDIKNSIMSAQSTNKYISHVHIIPKAGKNIFSTKSSGNDGIYDEYLAEQGGNLAPWTDSHPSLDKVLIMGDKDSYFLSYQQLSSNKRCIIVMDVSRSSIEEFLSGLDLGDGAIIGLVTDNGSELVAPSDIEGPVFVGQDFYEKALSGELDGDVEGSGSKEVKYNGKHYLFLYSTSALTNVKTCALVPMSTITAEADQIKYTTIFLVILACIIVIIIGLTIASGIQRNMKGISDKFGTVAKGDLTVEVMARGNDEFQGLAGSANNMIINTKKLVRKVTGAASRLETSSQSVAVASDSINEYSHDINQAITEINDGMTRQSEYARECVDTTDALSGEMALVVQKVEQVRNLLTETSSMIEKGMEIVALLGQRARETTEVTNEVGESIASLKHTSNRINDFVKTITDISTQTNLLSLNASIEAARAGEAGRGFSVVAEEIRNLADESAKAAGEISNNVGHITEQTQASVNSAKSASDMVSLQSEAVEQATMVFNTMQDRIRDLTAGLEAIMKATDKAERERQNAAAAVNNISQIIEETAGNAETVSSVADKLMESVDNLNQTAAGLDENMQELKTEVSVFTV